MTPKYAQRLELAARALEYLTLYPDGLSIADLAQLLDLDEYDTRQTLAAYHEGQELTGSYVPSPLLLATQPPPADWDGTSRSDWFDEHAAADIQAAVWVALDRDLGAHDPFGLRLDVPQIVELLTCADNLCAQEPDNQDLRSAVATLTLTWVPEMTLTSQAFPASGVLPVVRRAIVEHRRLRFTYCREWAPGTSIRLVDPYELKQTHLGYELDAGPVRDNGTIRTFLVRNMTEPQLLAETFPEPLEKARLIAANRRTITVKVVVPKDVRPSYESLVEHLDVTGGADDDDDDWELLVTLQQPFEERLALFLFRAGPQAFLVEDLSLMNHADFERYEGAADRLARQLLRHHGLG